MWILTRPLIILQWSFGLLTFGYSKKNCIFGSSSLRILRPIRTQAGTITDEFNHCRFLHLLNGSSVFPQFILYAPVHNQSLYCYLFNFLFFILLADAVEYHSMTLIAGSLELTPVFVGYDTCYYLRLNPRRLSRLRAFESPTHHSLREFLHIPQSPDRRICKSKTWRCGQNTRIWTHLSALMRSSFLSSLIALY